MQTIQRTSYTLPKMQKARIDLFKLAHECCAWNWAERCARFMERRYTRQQKNLNIILSSY